MPGLAARVLAFARDVRAYAGARAVEASVFVGLGAVLEGVGVVLLAPLLALIFSDTTVGLPGGRWTARLAADLGPTRALAVVLAGFGAVMALRALVLWRRDGLLGGLMVGYVEAQRRQVAHALAAARWETLARLGHARVTHVMGADIQRCGAGVQFLLQGGVAAFMLVVQVALAVALAPLAALMALALLAAGAAALAHLFGGAQVSGARVTGANLALMTGLGRFLGGMKSAMSQNLQGPFVAAFDRELEAASESQTGFIRQQSLLRVLWSLVGAATAALTLVVGIGALHLAPAVMIALLVILARIGAPASQIQLGVQQIAYSLTAWETVGALKTELRAAAAPIPTPSARRLSGDIVFADVTYRHAGDAGVEGLDLTIRPGEFVGVSGPSGSGKTTFADLLSGLLRPASGEIRVGGVLLEEADLPGWRDRTAYVCQDAFLFNDTIRNNLLWGIPDPGPEVVDRALTASGADRLIATLPSGLETTVGELGALVSGGERQRLALSRALLRRPDLLILDEATSAIDVDGERAVLARLATLSPRPAIVLIAHRRESFAQCDRVLDFGATRPSAPGAP